MKLLIFACLLLSACVSPTQIKIECVSAQTSKTCKVNFEHQGLLTDQEAAQIKELVNTLK